MSRGGEGGYLWFPPSVYNPGSRQRQDWRQWALSLLHKVTLHVGPVFRCVTRSSGVCERDYAKPQLPLAPV